MLMRAVPPPNPDREFEVASESACSMHRRVRERPDLKSRRLRGDVAS